jgi:GT2 family glycosyltransferase
MFASTNPVGEGGNLPSIYLAYPFTRPHFDGFLRSVVQTVAAAGGYGDVVLGPLPGFALDAARNALALSFLESGADFMLCVDNDARWQAEAVSRLVAHNLPMVCGCMYTRSLPPKPTIGRYIGETRKGTHLYKYLDVVKAIIEKARRLGIGDEVATNDMLMQPEPSDLMSVDGCGMHFTLIRRDVIEALRPPYFTFMGSTTAGEDYFFCRKVRAAGFPIYLDVSVQTAHIDSEDHDYGIKELLYLTKYLDLEHDLFEVDTWEMGA